MFNLIVDSDGEAWEAPPFSSPYVRFGEYSSEAGMELFDPKLVDSLTRAPTLLMYELGSVGPNVGVVRHGRLRNIERRGQEIIFDFEPDPDNAYLRREEVLARAEDLGVKGFERYRTHWAVKDGSIPHALVDLATPEIERRTVDAVAEDYAEAVSRRERTAEQTLLNEIEQFPASIEKARALLPARIARRATPELFALLGIKRGTQEARRAVDAVVARNASGEDLPGDWCFSVAWFLDEYGTPTERLMVEEAVGRCSDALRGLATDQDTHGVEATALALWRCARSRKLTGVLRREIGALIDRLERCRDPDGFWHDGPAGSMTRSVRATALATVALQRLGNDRLQGLLAGSVQWLLEQIDARKGAVPRHPEGGELDLVAPTFTMEAVRRSELAGQLEHVLARGDEWILSEQTERGAWTATPWPDDFTTAVVLGYLARRSDVLPHVDGFLLMVREFFRRGEELALEGGVNNRRLAAIAVVHAVEMFLYGVFEIREDLGLSAYRDDGAATLGPREALAELQSALRREGRLGEHQRLPRRNQLSSLIGRRDGIIHRAHEISETELGTGVTHARRFIERMGDDLLKLNLLE